MAPPVVDPAVAASVAPPDDDRSRTAIGANGGPEWDWRAEMAGQDSKALEVVSRYKAPGDFLKAFLEQRTKLSQRAEPVKIDDKSTPEQIAEYRKALDVPDVPKEAKDLAYAEAYGIQAPEGYELGEVEKGLLGAFAKKMNASHAPKAFVQKAVAEHFAIQQSMAAQAERVATVKAKEWSNQLRDQWGSKEYDARLAAANQLIHQTFGERMDEFHDLRLAQLPSGGRLGDHPFFIELLAEKAMGAGFTDRIEANAMESGGKSLAQRHSEIRALFRTDRAAYDRLAAPGGELSKVTDLRLKRGEIDQFGNELRKRG